FVEQADLGTEPLESLCQFATDGSAANHREPGRTLGKAEHSFVGQVARLSQSRDGRLRGPRAGCDDRTLEAQRLARDLNRVGACKFGLTQEHIHSQLGEARRRIVRADVRAELAHSLHDGRVIHARWIGRSHSEMAYRLRIESSARRSDYGLA